MAPVVQRNQSKRDDEFIECNARFAKFAVARPPQGRNAEHPYENAALPQTLPQRVTPNNGNYLYSKNPKPWKLQNCQKYIFDWYCAETNLNFEMFKKGERCTFEGRLILRPLKNIKHIRASVDGIFDDFWKNVKEWVW